MSDKKPSVKDTASTTSARSSKVARPSDARRSFQSMPRSSSVSSSHSALDTNSNYSSPRKNPSQYTAVSETSTNTLVKAQDRYSSASKEDLKPFKDHKASMATNASKKQSKSDIARKGSNTNRESSQRSKSSSRSSSTSKDTTTAVQRADISRPQSRRSSSQGGPRKPSDGSVEYVPRKDDNQRPSRRIVIVHVEEDVSDEDFPVYFETKEQRRNFVRIVYAILGIMLTVDFSMVALAYFVEPINTFVKENLFVYIIALVIFVIVYLLVACIDKIREKKPVNYIMLSILCLSMGYLLACITAFHSIQAILFAVAGTLFIVICATAFAMFCPCDMTGWGLYLCLVGMGLIGASAIVVMVCLLGLCGEKPWLVGLVISSLFVVLYAFYLAYDTQRILGGKKYNLRPNEYVNGALHLWIDVIYIFLCMLSIGRITAG